MILLPNVRINTTQSQEPTHCSFSRQRTNTDLVTMCFYKETAVDVASAGDGSGFWGRHIFFSPTMINLWNDVAMGVSYAHVKVKPTKTKTSGPDNTRNTCCTPGETQTIPPSAQDKKDWNPFSIKIKLPFLVTSLSLEMLVIWASICFLILQIKMF